MHWLTKVLAVFAAILSVTLSALVVAHASNTNSLKADYEKMKATSAANETVATDTRAGRAADQARHTRELQATQEQNRDLAEQISKLKDQLSEERSKASRGAADVTGEKARADALAATSEAQARTIAALRDEVSKIRGDLVSATLRENQANEARNQLESARQVLEQNVRALQEELRASQVALAQVKQGGTAGAASSKPFESTGPMVTARVTEVTSAPGGLMLARINAGSNLGLQPNMRMNIIRGDQFIATLVLTTVDVQQAVGRIDTLGRPVNVMNDDVVKSRLQ